MSEEDKLAPAAPDSALSPGAPSPPNSRGAPAGPGAAPSGPPEVPEAEEASSGAEEDSASSPSRPHSVFPYLAILFGTAFLLLLFAYLMQQRDSEEIMGNLSDLRESLGSIQSIDELVEENRTLREEVDGLKGQVAELESARQQQSGELAALEEKLTASEDLSAQRQTQIEGAQKVINAFNTLSALRQLCEEGDRDGARALVEGLEESNGMDEVEEGFAQYFAGGPDRPEDLENYPPLLEWRELKASLTEEEDS